MTITLRPEQEQQIADAMGTGAYQDPQAAIDRALEVLRSEEEWLHSHRDEVSAKIERAFAQFERGEFLTAEQSRAGLSQQPR
jgi:Arc/MetJ-type ribon-helix-helix transcriptional regulator